MRGLTEAGARRVGGKRYAPRPPAPLAKSTQTPAEAAAPTGNKPGNVIVERVCASAVSISRLGLAAAADQAPVPANPVAPPVPRSEPKPAPSGDPMAEEMADLARRRQEAERQRHLMRATRAIEDAEWEADDI